MTDDTEPKPTSKKYEPDPAWDWRKPERVFHRNRQGKVIEGDRSDIARGVDDLDPFTGRNE